MFTPLSLSPSFLTGAEESVAGRRREDREKRSPPYWGLWSSDFYGWLEELRARADHEGMQDLARTFWSHFPISTGLGYDSPQSDPKPEEWGWRETGCRFKSVRVGGSVLQHVFTCSQHGDVDILTLIDVCIYDKYMSYTCLIQHFIYHICCNCQNKCRQCLFLQTTDMFKHFFVFLLINSLDSIFSSFLWQCCAYSVIRRKHKNHLPEEKNMIWLKILILFVTNCLDMYLGLVKSLVCRNVYCHHCKATELLPQMIMRQINLHCVFLQWCYVLAALLFMFNSV